MPQPGEEGHRTPVTPRVLPLVDLHSALATAFMTDHPIKTADDLKTFLHWQASRCSEPEKQKRFQEDAMGYPHLLVFAAMRKKSPHIRLIHSAGTYPNVPGADRDWSGKTIGFLFPRGQNDGGNTTSD